MSNFAFIAASSEKYSDEINFAMHDGSKNVNVRYKPESASSYGGKTNEHFVIGKVSCYRNLEFTGSGLIHLAEVVYAIELAKFLWPILDSQKLNK